MTDPKIDKKLVRVEIPHDLLLEILYINYLLRIKEPSVTEETDDCIQTDHLCGGLWDKKKQKYGFTYYPNTKPDNYTWELEITKKQITQIAKGKINKLKLWRCKNEDCNHYYADKDSHCDFCNPTKYEKKPIYTEEELQKLQDEKQELFKRWKETQKKVLS